MPNYPVPYQSNWGYSGIGQQMYPQMQSGAMMPNAQPMPTAQQNERGLIWVDGEVGAKAYQLPAGWPANQPIALWDTNDTVIYLKSINPMGMPNPLQKAHYTLEEYRGVGMSGKNGTENTAAVPDMKEYVKKEDLERMKQDLIDTIGQMQASGTARRTGAKGE